MIKPSLQLRAGQQLALTPQLRQALRLLQLSSLELQSEIHEALDRNVMLEPLEPGDQPDSGSGEAAELRWPESTRPEGETPGEPPERARSLWDRLRWQLELTRLSERDRAIGLAVIDSIDERGYLAADLAELAEAVDLEDVGEPEIEAIVHTIQQFEPAGVGARSLAECLRLQLAALDSHTVGRDTAQRLVDHHLDEIARTTAKRLADRLSVATGEIERALTLLSHLDPRPGYQADDREAEYIVPDLIARRGRSGWGVALNPRATPRLGINRQYEALLGARGHSPLRAQLREAKSMVRGLEMRNETLHRVGEAVIGRQAGFLEHGEEHLRPLMLKDIAHELGLHESTISRVTTRKYVLTPHGVYELKHFFSGSVDDSADRAATAIRAMLRRLVSAEDPRRPLSDDKLASLLSEQGVRVARRTVAKYREALAIPPSHERKHLHAR